MNLQNKNILIAVTGGIAAYKINILVRDFIKKGAEVQVIMTASAKQFVTKATLSTLSKKPVYSDFFENNGLWNSHVELALWADIMLIAPCTANTLGKMIHGICDNLVIATYMSAKCPVFIAPAMDLDMYAHPSTRQNLEMAEDFGHFIIPAEEGELASGLFGPGRMAEPETILSAVEDFFSFSRKLTGKTVLITAGPTYAEEAAKRGARVILISGPTALKPEHSNIDIHRVTSAKEMANQVFNYYESCDLAIASAAVADYAPEVTADEKIKKKEDHLTLNLVKNPDILKAMGERKKNQILVGFALETQNEVENAKEKLNKKNLDLIVLNSLREAGAGFGHDTNKVKIITQNSEKSFGLKSKKEVARDILNCIEDEFLK